jgi:hypothetical protein
MFSRKEKINPLSTRRESITSDCTYTGIIKKIKTHIEKTTQPEARRMGQDVTNSAPHDVMRVDSTFAV